MRIVFPVRLRARLSVVLLMSFLTILMWAVSWGPLSDHSDYSRSLRGVLGIAPLLFVIALGLSLWALLQLRPSEVVVTGSEILIPPSSSTRTQVVAVSDIEAVTVDTDARRGRIVDLHLKSGRRTRVLVNMVQDREGLVSALTSIEGVEVTVLDRPTS